MADADAKASLQVTDAVDATGAVGIAEKTA